MRLGRSLLRNTDVEKPDKKFALGMFALNFLIWFVIERGLANVLKFNTLGRGIMLLFVLNLGTWHILYAYKKIKFNSWIRLNDVLQYLHICVGFYVMGYSAYYGEQGGWHQGIDSSDYFYMTQLISWIVWIIATGVMVRGGKIMDANERELTPKEEARILNIQKWGIAVVPISVAIAVLSKDWLTNVLKKFPAETGTSMFFLVSGLFVGMGVIAFLDDWLAMRREEKKERENVKEFKG